MEIICIGSVCFGAIMSVVYLLGDIGVRKGYEIQHKNKFKKQYKSRNK